VFFQSLSEKWPHETSVALFDVVKRHMAEAESRKSTDPYWYVSFEILNNSFSQKNLFRWKVQEACLLALGSISYQINADVSQGNDTTAQGTALDLTDFMSTYLLKALECSGSQKLCFFP